MSSDTKKGLTPREKKLGLVTVAIIIVVILGSCLFGFMRYRNSQNGARHAEIVRAEHQPKTPLRTK